MDPKQVVVSRCLYISLNNYLANIIPEPEGLCAVLQENQSVSYTTDYLLSSIGQIYLPPCCYHLYSRLCITQEM
jgi:hypothetical protein